MGRLSRQIFQLNHLEEAERNLRASQIDLLASGVRIIDLLFLILVFRRVQRVPRNAGSKDRDERPGRTERPGAAGSEERPGSERPVLGPGAAGSEERPGDEAGATGADGAVATGADGANTGLGANAGSTDRDERPGLGAGATGAD